MCQDGRVQRDQECPAAVSPLSLSLPTPPEPESCPPETSRRELAPLVPPTLSAMTLAPAQWEDDNIIHIFEICLYGRNLYDHMIGQQNIMFNILTFMLQTCKHLQ